ncbi:putative malate dehydrogenase [Arabidopsis thaliana]
MISFLKSLIRALDGDDDVFDFAFVASSVTELPYFATRTKIGKKRIEEVIDSDLQGLAKYEERAIKAIKPRVKVTIEKDITLLQRTFVAISVYKLLIVV